MNASDSILIAKKASVLLNIAWRVYKSHAPHPNHIHFLHNAGEYATDILGIAIERPYYICHNASDGNSRSDTVGLLDRHNKQIMIASHPPMELQRFTLAHELGHWELHPKLVAPHRDRPIDWFRLQQRNSLESQADCFAAHFLMPAKTLRDVFISTFGKPLCLRAESSTIMYWLERNLHLTVNRDRLMNNDVEYLALLIANTKVYASGPFTSLAKTFKVSDYAMAIQLRSCGLVS